VTLRWSFGLATPWHPQSPLVALREGRRWVGFEGGTRGGLCKAFKVGSKLPKAERQQAAALQGVVSSGRATLN